MFFFPTIVTVLVFTVVCLGLSVRRRNPFTLYIQFFVLIFAILFWGTRNGEAATDFPRYQQRFEVLSQLPWKDFFRFVETEYVFSFLMKLFSSFGFGFYAFYTFVVAICILSLYFACSQSSDLYKILFCSYVCFFFLYFPLVTNIMRQTLAFSLCLISIKYVFKNDFKHFILPIILALGFHMTAVLALPLWFIWNHNEDKPIKITTVSIICVAIVLLIVFAEPILGLLSSVFPALEKYVYYFVSNRLGENREFYLRCLEFCAMLLFRAKLELRDKRSSFFLILGFFSLISSGLGFINTYVKRVGYYFQVPFHLFFFSNLPLCFKKNERFFVITLEVVYFIIQALIFGTITQYDSMLF